MSHSDQDSTSAAGLFDILWESRADVLGALATTPEVAFIDIDLPRIDGYEVGRRIRAALGSRVLVVALAAYGQERRSSEAGFDAHLVKPVSHEDLTRVLGRAAGGNG